MSPDLALKIAAGEVVERPASAVKELLDNAIDAGATVIAIDVIDAGLQRLRVTDNGEGIPAQEVPLAFASHATSKIADLADLEQLASLGFRGEALPSIAAVSRVDLQTKTPDAPAGARFAVDFGVAETTTTCATPTGTRITVSDLFGNVPARRKFVRSLRAEGGQIQSVVMHYALARPGIRFTLSIDGRVTFSSPGTGSLGDAFAAVHGADILKDMIPVEAEENGIVVDGLISRPERTKSNRTGITVFVNGRVVNNRSLIYALEEAYSGFIMQGRHPYAAVHLQLPPHDIDANIHPSKSEVRFAREREVHGSLYRCVAGALLDLRAGAQAGSAAFEASASGVESISEQTTAEQASLLDTDSPEDTVLVAAPLLTGLPVLRVFGQANSTFIIAEGPTGLYMIDQHAAHERVLYDLFDEELSRGGIEVQGLLEPLSLTLTPEQMLSLDENGTLLSQVGFAIEPFGTDACLVRSIPAQAGRGSPAELVYEVLNELAAIPEPSAARERALAAMACKAAVKAGARLDVQEMRELVARLERTLRPATCPHGRPTMIHMSHSQLEREFGRR